VPEINRKRLFLTTCIAMVTIAMPFAIRSDILSALGREFDLSHEQQGLMQAAASWGYPFSVLAGGLLCDIVGMRLLMLMACGGHIAGIIFTILSPAFGFPVLLFATFIMGLADGTAESAMNPLVATLYPRQKTGRLSLLHAGWPLGLIIAGLLCLFVTKITGAGLPEAPAAVVSISWRIKMSLVLFPAILYGILSVGQFFPGTECRESGVSMMEMLKEGFRPGFIILLLCMILTSAAEVGPDQWFGSALKDTVGIGGIAFLVFTSCFMLVLRYNGGKLADALTPFGLLVGSCFMAGLGLWWLSHAFTPLAALAAAALFGIGKSCLWPTILGVTSERYPRGGSFLLAIMSAIGILAGGMSGPVLGRVYDRYTIVNLPATVAQAVVVDGRYSPVASAKLSAPADRAAIREAEKQGAAMTFRLSAAAPVLPLFVFLVMGIRHRMRGGYRIVNIGGKRGNR